jgi:hypothetical protein
VRKDNLVFGRVHVDFLPEDGQGGAPLLIGEGRARSPRVAGIVPPGVLTVAETGFRSGLPDASPSARSGPREPSPGEKAADPLSPDPPAATVGDAAGSLPPAVDPPLVPASPERSAPLIPVASPGTTVDHISGGDRGEVTGFLLEVDGRPVRLVPGEQVAVAMGSRVRMVDLQTDGKPLPHGVVMNLRGFVSPGNTARNTGEDRGATADTAKDMMPAFSENRRGEVYAVNAELGRTVLATCFLKILRPTLESVTVRFDGRTRILPRGSRTHIADGAKVEVVSVTMEGGLVLQAPRFTLGGRHFSADLPQTLTMRGIALNLAVFEGDALTGKVTWVPW